MGQRERAHQKGNISVRASFSAIGRICKVCLTNFVLPQRKILLLAFPLSQWCGALQAVIFDFSKKRQLKASLSHFLDSFKVENENMLKG